MSSIKLESNASGTGIFTIASPNSNTNRTLSLPDNTGTIITTGSSGQVIPKAALPTGSVLQVVSTTKTDTFSMASSTFSDVTGLSVSITPTASSSKILIFSVLNWGSSANDINVARLLRDSTVISAGDAAGNRSPGFGAMRTANADNIVTNSGVFLDSPSTTSSVTYKIQVRRGSGDTVYVNRTSNDTDISAFPRLVSSITVMEIAA